MSRGKRRFPLTITDAADGLLKRLFLRPIFLFFSMGQPNDQATRHPFAVSGLILPIDLYRRLSLGQPSGLETDFKVNASQTLAQSPIKRGPEGRSFGKKGYVCSFHAANLGDWKSFPCRSTASMYSTSLRATASVARLRLPRASSFS